MTKTVHLPKLADNAPGINGFKCKSRFGVIVICEDEAHHKQVYAELSAKGYKCKAVRV